MGKPNIFPFDIQQLLKLNFNRLPAATDVQDSDLLATYRSTGPLKKLTALIFGNWVVKTLTGFIQVGVGAVARTAQNKMRDTPLTPEDYGAVGDNVTDDTVALQKLWDAAIAQGKDIHLTGGIYRASGLVWSYSATTPVVVTGDGQYTSVIRKFGTNADPVLTIEGSGALREIFSVFAGFSVDADGQSCPAARIKNISRFSFHDVLFQSGTRALDVQGALTGMFYNCNLVAGTDGAYCRKLGAVYPNMLTFVGCGFRGQTRHPIDFGDGEALTLEDCEISGCGTAGSLTDSGIVIRSSAGTENGGGTLRLLNNYFEANNGTNFRVENGLSTTLSLYMESNKFYATETIAGVRNVAIIGDINNVTMIDTQAASAIDTITIAANSSYVSGGTIGVLTDTSTTFTRIGVTTASSGPNDQRMKYALRRENIGGVDYIFGNSADITGGPAGVMDLFTASGSGAWRFYAGGVAQDIIGPNNRSFFGGTPVPKQAITGALSAVTDANAKAVLTSIITALDDAGYNLVTDSTT